MALNREDKRKLQKQGGDPDEEAPAGASTAQAPRSKEQRTSARQFVREVRSELRKVAWPTKSETINYSVIVLVALIFLTALIFLIDLAFADLILRLFNAK